MLKRNAFLGADLINAEMLRLDIDDRLYQFGLRLFRPIGNAFQQCFDDLVHRSIISELTAERTPHRAAACAFASVFASFSESLPASLSSLRSARCIVSL